MTVPRTYKPAELGAILGGASHRKVVDWTRTYNWPHVGVGRTVVFTEEHINDILAIQTVAPSVASRPRLSGQTPRSAARAS